MRSHLFKHCATCDEKVLRNFSHGIYSLAVKTGGHQIVCAASEHGVGRKRSDIPDTASSFV